MNITTTPESTPAILIDAAGDSGRVHLTAAQLKTTLDNAFKNRPTKAASAPGVLTGLIDLLPEEQLDLPVPPPLAVAALTSHALQSKDTETERPAVEAGIRAQVAGKFLFNNHKMVKVNGWQPTSEQIEELGKQTVAAYRKKGWIKKGDTVIDVGAGHCYVSKHLKLEGIDVEAIEPAATRAGKAVFRDVQPLTAEQYIAKFSGKRFSVVHAGNFSPIDREGWIEMASGKRAPRIKKESCKQMIGQLSNLTADEGIALIGINSMDPQFVSGTSEYRLRPLLEKHFGKVEYFSPKKVYEDDQHFSIGGQMGVFKCSLPKR